MKVFLRQLTENDTKRQIETTAEAYQYFFGGSLDDTGGINFTVHIQGGEEESFKVSRVAGSANSYRFGSSAKGGISFSGYINKNIKNGYKANDILIMYEINGVYTLDIIKEHMTSYDTLKTLIRKRQNTIILSDDSVDSGDSNVSVNDDCIDISDNNDNVNNKQSGYNKIYYGIPGCGKSHHIETEVLKGVDKENNVFRTTFYLDYSNSDFIGQIYPHVEDKKVTYEPIPGPFTKALERALSTDEMVYLVIEEINRGNAAAIFGDVFQLLDRLKEDKPDGRVVGDSEYPISNAFIEGYFDRVNEKAENADGVKKINFKKGQIIIPHNLTILATMNTSDQNVFPLDTAFKRRWDREKVVTEWSKVKNIKYMYIPCSSITWKQFVTTINQKMLQESQNGDVTISEDKQIGPYFVHESMLSATKNTGGKKELTAFVNNVLDYLYNDVTKFDHSILFDKKIYTYDTLYDLMEEYHYQGDKLFEVVFKDSVQKALEEAVNKDSTQEEPINTPEEEYADTEVESMEEPNE